MQLGSKIKKLRELRNRTQLEMAELLGITQGNYSKMELGKLDIPYSKLEEIAQILDIGVEDIVCFSENLVFNLKNNKKANGLVINQFSQAERKLFEEYIGSLKEENAHLKKMVEKLITKK